MFDLIPFGRNERNLFNYLDNVERSFWDGSISNMAQFRCDVQDKGRQLSAGGRAAGL